MPCAEDLFDKIAGCPWLLTCDVSDAYHHIEVEESSRDYTTFVTDCGRYRFVVSPSA